MKIMPTATTKLKVRAAAGPHNRCCWRLAPSDERSSWKSEARISSSALPELTTNGEKLKHISENLS